MRRDFLGLLLPAIPPFRGMGGPTQKVEPNATSTAAREEPGLGLPQGRPREKAMVRLRSPLTSSEIGESAQARR